MTMHVAASAQRWDKTSYDGIQICVLRRDAETGGGSVLLKFRPRARFPRHDHPGGEEVYVLQGEIVVGEDSLSEGDYLWTSPGGTHDVTARKETVLLASAPKGIQILE